MPADAPANGHTANPLPEQASTGAAAPKSTASRARPAAPPRDVFTKTTRLCLVVPLHLVKRLEAHAAGEGKTRDRFATDLIEWAMQYSYRKRDKLLREAFAVDEPEGEAD